MGERAGNIPLPPHAYVPGKTPRHPEGWFDRLTADVPIGGSETALQASTAWAAGMFYFEQGYYWECHEVLEAVWMQAAPDTPTRHMVQAVIQLANARLKLAMGRPKATLRLCDIVQNHLSYCASCPLILDLDPLKVEKWCAITRNLASDR